jgi:uncharacterized membrane protein
MKKSTRTKNLIELIILICLLAGGAILLPETDFVVMVKWEAASIALGIAAFPAAGRLFPDFSDRGWLFSKALGFAAGGYVTWLLVCAGVPFGNRACYLVTLALAVLVFGLYGVKRRKRASGSLLPDAAGMWKKISGEGTITAMLAGEILFLALMLFWVWVIGFRPEAHGTEKYMDYGFIASINRSTAMPAPDIWHSQDPINYYYGGQYFTVYLMKLTFTGPAYGYSMMRALIASFAGALPFSLVDQLLKKRFENGESRFAKIFPAIGGGTALAAVSLAGNLHYVLYGLFGKVFRLSGYEDYWFPDSTRYIGHNPETNDQCIHEFPSYSSVLGDLHAHYINLIFVLLFLGVLASWMTRALSGKRREKGILREVFSLPFLLLAVLDGMFQFTNYWDYVIYLTVLILACAVAAIPDFLSGRQKRGLAVLALRIVTAAVIGQLAALPFTANFTAPVSSVAVVKNHTPLYQFAILWGFPVAASLFFLVTRAAGGRKRMRKDAFFLLLTICAVGLVCIPELVYVRDIYEKTSARANTMFKLTYQAFVMFGLIFGYSLPVLFAERGRMKKIAGVMIAGVLALTVCYFPYAIACWFGNITKADQRFDLDASAFVTSQYPDEAGMIDWLNEHVSGSPVVLESYGDSYSDNCRVSAMTGLPTVEGWYVHEWLWRGDTAEQNQRVADVTELYTTSDRTRAAELIRKYHISYIVVGSCERTQFPELNEKTLGSLGTIVWQSGDAQSYLIDVTGLLESN